MIVPPPLGPQPTLLAAGLVAIVLLWLVSLWRKDVSIVDIWWGPAIALNADLMAVLVRPRAELAVILLLGVVNIWAIRLATHIFARHHGEDYRYAAMRTKNGESWWWRSLFQVFLLQGILIWIVSQPLIIAVSENRNWFAPLVWLGAAVAAGGVILEAVADAQLTSFRADPDNAKKVMQSGVWAWSRHPNYFGDTAMWWGFFLLSLGASGRWWPVEGPLIMTVLLLKVSGVSLLEESIGERRPGYADYARRTSAFIPWPPREK